VAPGCNGRPWDETHMEGQSQLNINSCDRNPKFAEIFRLITNYQKAASAGDFVHERLLHDLLEEALSTLDENERAALNEYLRERLSGTLCGRLVDLASGNSDSPVPRHAECCSVVGIGQCVTDYLGWHRLGAGVAESRRFKLNQLEEDRFARERRVTTEPCGRLRRPSGFPPWQCRRPSRRAPRPR
jgi:hypothetical protein